MPISNIYQYEHEITWVHNEIDDVYSEQIDISDKEDDHESQDEKVSYESLNSQDFQDATRATYSWNEEIDRLHLQHYHFKYIWQKNFSAPIEHRLKENARILDVGCGAGTWLLEMSTDFPRSTFVGVDIATMYPSDVMPLNCEFMQCNVLDGIQFADNTFDFVHMRLMTFAFIDNEWFEKVINELIRVLKSGGMVEIMVINKNKSNQGPVTKQLCNAYRVKDCLMSTDQLKDVIQEEKLIPIGKWAGNFGISFEDLHNSWPSVRIPLSTHMSISPENFDELVDKCVNEIDEFKTYFNTARIYVRDRLIVDRQLISKPPKISTSLHRNAALWLITSVVIECRSGLPVVMLIVIENSVFNDFNDLEHICLINEVIRRAATLSVQPKAEKLVSDYHI
ncbi:S-adenosyl-L-methionine-dependent methyltransferase [Rhizophagus clarus]|uniref:S-adenosyl-L-methionine-dependent methyltransferase n=1 Tax=Rhizophagus clarus TaxID=94130 RepID=A0A8H3LAP5_9GLOM|nr:S-adenosyl-L-methionine-dependent methyltransferase [Rhizophagus clarus]